MYTLAWRHTAGEGAGSRVVIVNGATQAQATKGSKTSLDIDELIVTAFQ